MKTVRKFREGQRTFTTGEVAYLLDVTVRTATNIMVEDSESGPWPYDTTKLPCFRLPGRGHRRVTRENLVAYMRRAGLTRSLQEIGEEV